jgi:nicotinate-nucleotide adenylyltransferase
VTHGLGLLGGTFDPPHGFHVVMAQTAREALGLERVLMLPAPRPPHKQGEPVTAWEHRVAMLEAAVKGVDGVEVSDIESAREGASFTVDTLRACRDRFGPDLYFIMGADSLRDLPAWRDPEGILALCSLVVFPRTGIPMRLPVPGDASVVVFESPVIDVSSTDIRSRFERGERPSELVPDPVLDYIERNGLYHTH